MAQRLQWVLFGLACFFLGCLVTAQRPFAHAQESKGPKWLHGLDLRVRRGGEAEFTKETKKFGIEVFRDEHNGNLIYISEVGSIAVIPAR